MFPMACCAMVIGTIYLGMSVWLSCVVMAMAALCWITRHATYDPLIRLICAIALSGGAFALLVSAAVSALNGMAAEAAVSMGCATLSGMAASTQMRRAGRLILDTVGFIRDKIT